MEIPNRYTVTLDDDLSISRIIAQVTGISSLPFVTAEALLKKASSFDPVAAFVDVHLDTDESGLKHIPELRKLWPFTPIIVVTSDPKDHLIGEALAMGANDFIRKPIVPLELTGRLHARILEMGSRRKNDIIEIGDFHFSPGQALISKGTLVSYLPKLETQLLAILVEQRDLVVSRDELKHRLWGRIVVAENTLDRKISDIRKAFADIGSKCIIQSVYRKGIRLSFAQTDEKTDPSATKSAV